MKNRPILNFLQFCASRMHVPIILCLSLLQCTIYQRLTDPKENPLADVANRCAIVKVDVPPITLTPERTAAERQLIGEEKELLPDGWLISSSSYLPPQPSAVSHLPENVRAEYRMLVLYDDILLRYRYLEFLGEGRDGEVFFVPEKNAGRRLNGEERIRLQAIVAEVNRARKQIYRYYLENNETQAEDFRHSFFLAAGRNEWVRDESGRIVKKASL
ncbi:MAG: YdbL family protein [Leptonema illini]|uniref:YdbL family protein n=1 Tax=Leptonema illini TaxID=183 RepID=A0A833H4F4_9LEPT|nr:MAG: YdbL family protein [Leptonema illini]PKL34655.1 MAG: hypothetical protein CVV45_02125 [Spirochaetae bacterium HGW-Spirochaetae-10]